MIHPVILCGGPGSRLWPVSTPAFPKPFLDLIGGASLFQRTVTRMAGLKGAGAPLVVTGIAHLELARRQMREAGVAGSILAEPEGRDSGPAIVAAALAIARRDPRGLVMTVHSDHHIPDDGAFAARVETARAAAEAGHIVTFGVRPTHPSAAYGYIQPGPLADGSEVRPVAAFLEKPAEARARAMIAEGCLWNSGNLLFQAEVMVAEAERHCGDLVERLARALDEASGAPEARTLGPAFRGCAKVPIDIGVMEKTHRAAVVPVDYDWSDLGAWEAIWAASAKDESGNALMGQVAAADSRDCLLRAEPGVELAAVGLSGVAVVATAGQVLVCDLAKSGAIKTAIAALPVYAPARAAEDAGATLTATRDRLTLWLDGEALPLWWSLGADHGRGGFHEGLTWRLVPADLSRRLRVPARQAVVYAAAGLRGWKGPWAAAVRHGLAWIEARHRRPDGLYRTRVKPDGAAEDDAAHLYDQAFVLLALASAARVLSEDREALIAEGRGLAGRIVAAFGHDDGGFRAFEGAAAFEADPIMHLFEASQAWMEADSWPGWAELAGGIAEHFLARMIDRDRPLIRESFAADWTAASGIAGRRVLPGHQFEWAYLLERWGLRSGDEAARAAAGGLYATGEAGVEAASGVTLMELMDDLRPTGPGARLWPQAERLRAALWLESDPERRAAAALSAAEALASYFTREPAGLWRDSRPGPGAAEETSATASSLYHIVGAIDALATRLSP